jgi:tetratricopeptide (TPR) repeat protein/transglutaminase-like putative cysteine protease
MTISRWLVPLVAVLFTSLPSNLTAQTPIKAEPRDYTKEPFVLEKIANKIEFENDGKYVEKTEIRVHVQSASGVQNWGVIRLPYASSLGDAEIANVKVTKTDGTVVTTPLENTQDVPAQITIAAPFYSDLKEKDLAVKGLDSGDILEYSEVFHARSPLIPDQFWFDHSFFTQGIVLSNELRISVPRGRYVKVSSSRVSPTETDEGGYHVYTWKTANLEPASDGGKTKKEKTIGQDSPTMHFADVELTSFRSWDEIAQWYRQLQDSRLTLTPELRAKAEEVTRGATSENDKIRALYGYVSTKFRYIGVALGIGRYQPHAATDVLGNGYGDCKDKHTVLAALLAAEGIKAYPALIYSSRKANQDVPSPGHFDHMITVVPQGKNLLWLDTTPEVAPFGLLTANLRDNQALIIPDSGPAQLIKTPANPPFQSLFSFRITGRISDDGTLQAKAEARVRGDVEVALRSAFRRTPQPQWKDVVQALSRVWNFAGTVSDVTVSSPEAIDDAFSFEYAYTRKDYPNWPDAIRPPLPPINIAQLPEDADGSSEPIPLESPGEYVTDAKVELPNNVTPRLHTAIDIKKDFAEYHASYSMDSNVLHSERHLIIHTAEVPRTRSGEYQAFSKGVSDDGDSLMSLSRATSSASSSPSKEENPVPGGTSADVRAENVVDLGDQLFSQGDLDGAIEEYRKALQLQPDNIRAHRTLGDALFNKNVFDEAATEYREVIRLKPGDAEAHSSLGDVLSDRDANGAIVEYREAIRLKPGYAPAHRSLGTALFYEGDFDQAIAEYNEAVRLNPDDPVAHYNFGDALFRKGDIDGAVREYRETLRLKPDDLQASYGLSSALLRTGAAAQVIDQMKKSITAAPQNPEGYQILADAYAYLHRYADALEAWKQIEKVSPGDPNAARGMGMILIQEKRYAEAIAKLQPAVESNPEIAPLAFTLGAAFARAGDGDKAMAAFQRALEVNSTSSELNAVGYELADANVRLDDALHYSEQAVRQQENATTTIDLATLALPDLRKMPALAAYWDTLGWAHFRLGHMEKAEKYLNAAWKLEQFPAIGDHLGQLYEKIGNKQQAILFYALTLATNHAPRETGGRLENLAGSKAKADETVREGLNALGQQRTTQLARAAKGRATAEFFVLFAPDAGIADAKFITGPEELQGAVKAIATAKFDVGFPDDQPVKLVRRGILDCPTTGNSCQFVLLPPESVNSVN